MSAESLIPTLHDLDTVYTACLGAVGLCEGKAGSERQSPQPGYRARSSALFPGVINVHNQYFIKLSNFRCIYILKSYKSVDPMHLCIH